MDERSEKTLRSDLRQLISERFDLEGAASEIFHWGIVPSSEGRNPRDDRANALVALAVLDQALQLALEKALPRKDAKIEMELFEGDGAPLRDISSKIKIAYALSIIGDETKKDLNRLRLVRNVFAHSPKKLTFETSEIAASCSRLGLIKRWPQMSDETLDARELFLLTCTEYSLWLFAFVIHFKDGLDQFSGFQRDLLST